MKNLTMNLLFAATALAAVAGSASAQTMEARIPFAFRASGKVLPAGTYRVELKSAQSGDRVVVISTPAGKSQMLTMGYRNGPATASQRSAGNAVLSFQCGVSRCALKDIWMGAADSVYRIPVPKLGKDESVHTAEIVLTAVKGD